MEKYFINDPKNPKARSLRNHGLRAAINTPVQGGAADIVIAAMIKIRISKRLKNLGYKLILQVHDELILVINYNYNRKALKRMQRKHLKSLRKRWSSRLDSNWSCL